MRHRIFIIILVLKSNIRLARHSRIERNHNALAMPNHKSTRGRIPIAFAIQCDIRAVCAYGKPR